MNYTALGLRIGLTCMALSATFTGGISIASDSPSWTNNTIRVGTVDDYLPCSDQINQHFEGLSIDIWRRISERLNIGYTIEPIPSFDQAITRAANGEFDLIASCHEITPERLQSIEYAIPYTTGGIVIATESQKPVTTLVSKIIQNKIVVRCSILLVVSRTKHGCQAISKNQKPPERTKQDDWQKHGHS